MAVTPNSLISVQTPKAILGQLSTADTVSVLKAIYTGSPNGSKIVGLWVSNADSVGHTLDVDIQRSGSSYGCLRTTITASAGYSNGTPSINLMSTAIWPGLPFDNDGNPFLFLQSTLDTLSVSYASTFTTTTLLNIIGVAADF